jgi:hypothetical protein
MTITDAIIVDTTDLEPETVAEIRKAVAEILGAASTIAPDPNAICGWTAQTAEELDTRLRAAYRPVQANAIAAAAHAGGVVDRASVYAIGSYESTRNLNGFTKPVRNAIKDMVAEGLLPADAVNPLEPVYDSSNASYQKAQGFSMPAELAELFAATLSKPEWDQTV